MSGSQQSLAGLILAAGGSSRLGSPKQLLRWRGKELVCHAVEQSLAVCDSGVVVVSGAQAAAVEGCLQGYDAEVVFNPHWEAGVATSLAIGVGAIRLRDACGVLVMLCDQPMLQVNDLARLAAIWRAAPDIPAAARYAAVLGAPAIFPSGYFARLAGLQGDLGARALLRDQDCCSILDIPEAALDVDTAADVDRLRRYDY